MKRFFCLMLAAALLCGCLPTALAADSLVDVRCEEQDFATRIPSQMTAGYEEGLGLRVSVGTPGYVPYLLVSRRPMELKFNNPTNYLNNVYREYMEDKYGDDMIGTNPCREYTVGGKTLLGARYMYRVGETTLCLMRLIEVRDDGDVEYTAKYIEGEEDLPLSTLEIVVQNYRTGGAPVIEEAEEAAAEAPAAADLQTVRCEQDKYTIQIPQNISAIYDDEDQAMYLWLGSVGYVPNIYIVRRTGSNKLKNPENYVKNVFTDYMEKTYGDSLRGTALYEYYDIGGKRLLASGYIYKSNSGNIINQLGLVEVRDDGDVEYVCRYLNSGREEALAALDAAVRSYQPDKAEAPVETKQETGNGLQLNATKAKPIVSGTQQYKDGRFYINLPTGWQITTSGEYMTFSFKAWDPANPNRTIYLNMKLEPFLKSWAAKETFQRVNNSLGGQSMYKTTADAPVMESCTLKGFLDAIPQVRAYCEQYYQSGVSLNPSVFPDINNVEIVEKKASSLPAPATCKENVIARITFEDSLGQPCEGQVTAQPLDTFSYDFYGVDGWPYTVYLSMGITAPMGELQELEPVLTGCLNSFGFEQSYVAKAINVSNEETQALLAQARTMQAAHDAMVDAWYAREQSHDIAMQKWSDSFRGYDRLYDSSTGEVYLADLGFYDSYDLHRGEYNNSNLQLVDNSTQQYYLQSADYYITK